MRARSAGTVATRFSLCLCALMGIACGEPSAPPDLERRTAAVQGEQPFYYYGDTPVLLEHDSEVLVISSRDQMVEQSVMLALAALGVQVNRVERLDHVPDHWILHLARGSTTTTASDIAARVRSDPRFNFAMTGLRLPGTLDRMLPVNRVGVRFKASASRTAIDSLIGSMGGSIVREPRPEYGIPEYWVSYAPDEAEPLQVAAAYHEHPQVQYAHPDMINEVVQHFVPSDPFYGLQYYLKNSVELFGVRVDINVEAAWDMEPTRGCGVPSLGCITVAVIDDGVQAAHPDLNGRVSEGYDVFSGGAANDPTNDPSHGTLVAGLVIGQHNSQGVAGIAPGAYVFPVRMFRPTTEGLPATDLQIADGINVAWMVGAKVLSNSWGYNPEYPGNNAVTNAINSATVDGRSGLGALVVFSAGNNSNRAGNHIGIVSYPARLPNVLAVGAINRSGEVTNYSPEGYELDIVAPSGHITDPCIGDVVTTDLTGARGCSDGPNGNIDYSSTFSGTSAAAPQVAGIATLLMAKEPALSESAIRSRLMGSADPWGPSFRFGAGKLNGARALTVPPLSISISGPYEAEPYGTCSWIANVSGGVQPYSFTWRADGASIGNSSDVYYTNSGVSFVLEVTVTDATSQSRADSRTISVYGGAGSCPF